MSGLMRTAPAPWQGNAGESVVSVWVAEDRSMSVQPGQVVRTAWIPIDDCVLGSRGNISPAAVERSAQRLVCLGECAPWPPIVGHRREDGRFSVDDGRHEYLASLMLGRERVFVAWLSEAEPLACT